MRTWVVTPTYNERQNIEVLLARLLVLDGNVSVLVVDDGSPDGTGERVAELARSEPRLRLHARAGKQGLASAYIDGFRLALEAGAERVVQMDADLSHDPDDVPRLLAADADLVLGSRYVPGGAVRNWPLHRQLLSRGGSAYARLLLGLKQRDLTGGFKAWRAPALRAVLEGPVASNGYVFQAETTLRAARLGLSVVEVPIVFTEREAGRSKLSGAIALEAVWKVPQLRWS